MNGSDHGLKHHRSVYVSTHFIISSGKILSSFGNSEFNLNTEFILQLLGKCDLSNLGPSWENYVGSSSPKVLLEI
jgi:hypothetical protein